MDSNTSIGQVSKIAVGVLIGLSYLSPASITEASQTDMSEEDEARMLSNYEAALANGDETTAVKHVLEFSEKSIGENDPTTARLTHRYGFLLFQDGEYR